MATVTTPTRQPFGEVNPFRLQSLSATKNRQNALTEFLSNNTKDDKPPSTMSSKGPSKRSLAQTLFEDENLDSENLVPTFFSKRSKGFNGAAFLKPTKPHFFLHTDSDMKDEDSENASPLTPTTPTHFPTQSPTTQNSKAPKDASINLPSVSSAPAGRSPKHKRIGILSKKRTSLSPFRRVDPPPFGSLKSSLQSTLNRNNITAPDNGPLSIDAALNGTLAKSKPSKAATLGESMPKGWFFDIHEDTPDEEAAIVMEHSTGILDISSDDETGSSRSKDERGKENVPPPEDVTQGPNGEEATPAAEPAKLRRSTDADAMTEEDRAPLGTLPAKDFYANGLHANSVEVVGAETHEPSDAGVVAQGSKGVVDDGKENAVTTDDAHWPGIDGSRVNASSITSDAGDFNIAVDETATPVAISTTA